MGMPPMTDLEARVTEKSSAQSETDKERKEERKGKRTITIRKGNVLGGDDIVIILHLNFVISGRSDDVSADVDAWAITEHVSSVLAARALNVDFEGVDIDVGRLVILI